MNSKEELPASIPLRRRKLPKSDSVSQSSIIASSPSTLPARLVGDVFTAVAISFGIAPIVSIIDKAIVQRSAGTDTIAKSCIKTASLALRNPASFVSSPAFLMMWAVYASTYTGANAAQTLAEEYKDKVSDATSQRSIFFTTTIINSVASLLKDRAFAMQFGTSGASGSIARKIPTISYALWSLRDCTVIGSSFILPNLAAPHLHKTVGVNYGWTRSESQRVSQILCPILAQTVATPFQLMGLDHYNKQLIRPKNAGFLLWHADVALGRWRMIQKNYWSVLGARVARIAPAFSIGGVYNTQMRNSWRSYLANNHSLIHSR